MNLIMYSRLRQKPDMYLEAVASWGCLYWGQCWSLPPDRPELGNEGERFGSLLTSRIHMYTAIQPMVQYCYTAHSPILLHSPWSNTATQSMVQYCHTANGPILTHSPWSNTATQPMVQYWHTGHGPILLHTAHGPILLHSPWSNTAATQPMVQYYYT